VVSWERRARRDAFEVAELRSRSTRALLLCAVRCQPPPAVAVARQGGWFPMPGCPGPPSIRSGRFRP